MVGSLQSSAIEPLRVRLFGVPLVSYDGKPVRFVATRTLPLFVYLLLERDRPIARDRLAYTFWPDASEHEARGNLRRHLHRINGPLLEASGRRWIEAGDRTVAFDSRMPLDLDVAQMEAASAKTDDAASLVDLYAGDLFEGCDEEWLVPHRERLRSSYLRLLIGIVDRYRGERRFAEAIALSRRILNVDSLREDVVRTLMSLHYESGDRSSALGEFRAFREVLHREIGAEPMRETQSLHDAILQHVAIAAQSNELPSLGPAMPFEGRDGEVEALRREWRRAAGGTGRVAIVSGEAGIGKTRLLREFATLAEREGARVLWGASSTPEAVPYEPVTEALTSAIGEIARLPLSPALLGAIATRFPELRAMRPEIPESVDLIDRRDRERFFDAIALAIERLCATRPTVVVFEDLHRVAADTFQLIARIARTCARSPFFAILSFREEAMTGAAREFTLDASMKHALRIGVGRLESSACRKILTLRRDAVAADVAEWAIDLAKGNPLFLNELVRQYDGVAPEGSNVSNDLPTTLESAILVRLSTLSGSARSLIDIAAVGSGGVSVDVLQYASGWPLAEVLDATDELVDRSVLRETATGSRGDFEFAHELIRDAVVRVMPAGVRTRRHRRFAKALVHFFPSREDDVARTLAHHYEQAGQTDEAAVAYARAANVAHVQFAWQDAIMLAERALALERRPRERFSINATIESAASKSGDGARQIAAIATLLQLAEDLDDDALRTVALARSSEAGLQTGDPDRQRRATERLEAIAIARGDTEGLRHALRCRARAEIAFGRPASAIATLQSMEKLAPAERPLAEQIDDLRMLAHARGAASHFEEALATVAEAERRAGSEPELAGRLGLVRARATLALEMSDRAEATRLSPILLELCRRAGDVEGEGNAHQHAARVDWWCFDVASARRNIGAATAIFERIGKLQSRAAIAINAGALENHVGLLDEAEGFYREALAYDERLDNATLRTLCHSNFAYVALLREDPERALVHAGIAVDLARREENSRFLAIALGHTGSALGMLADGARRSAACFTEALDLCRGFAFHDERLELIADAIPTLLALGEHGEAARYAEELEGAIAADASAVVMPVVALARAADAVEAVSGEAAAAAPRARARALLHARLETLPDERTRAAYAALPRHRALLDAELTSVRNLRPAR